MRGGFIDACCIDCAPSPHDVIVGDHESLSTLCLSVSPHLETFVILFMRRAILVPCRRALIFVSCSGGRGMYFRLFFDEQGDRDIADPR